MSTKTDLQRILGVIASVAGSTDPDDMATTKLYVQKMRGQIDALTTTESTVIATENPWQPTVPTGMCFGGKYVVTKRLNATKHIYLCAHQLFQDAADTIESEVVIKCTFLREGMSPAEIAAIAEQEKRAIRVTGLDVSDCPYSVGLIDAGELTTPEGTVILYWQAFKKMDCDASQLRSIMGSDIPPFIIMRIARQIIEVLVHYHIAGIVHRDIKPHNLLCAWPKNELLREIWKLLINFSLTDAQLAMGTALDTSVTHAGMILGTPQYMPPEQIRDSSKVSPKSDIFSFAVTLYELITGELPRSPITSMAQLHAFMDEQPKPFSAHIRAMDYPPWFRRLMDQSLSMKENERPDAYDWFSALLTEDARMPLAFEAMPPLLLGQGVPPPE